MYEEQRHIVPSPHSPSQTGVNALMAGEGQGEGWWIERRAQKGFPAQTLDAQIVCGGISPAANNDC